MHASNAKFCRPQIECRRTSRIRGGAWLEVEPFFADADVICTRQAWRDSPQPEFRPAQIRTAWDGTHLFVYAVLDDEDIFNPERRFNEPSFRCGDVFEMFFRPANQEAYFEFHVSPFNQQFQLRIPSAAEMKAARRSPKIPPDWLIPEPTFESQVLVESPKRRWRVVAAIPIRRLEEKGVAPEWRFSFSRYDYTRGREMPVLSSTSPHPVPDFHLQEDWGSLFFAGRGEMS